MSVHKTYIVLHTWSPSGQHFQIIIRSEVLKNTNTATVDTKLIKLYQASESGQRWKEIGKYSLPFYTA